MVYVSFGINHCVAIRLDVLHEHLCYGDDLNKVKIYIQNCQNQHQSTKQSILMFHNHGKFEIQPKYICNAFTTSHPSTIIYA